jgi:hypothetical protein
MIHCLRLWYKFFFSFEWRVIAIMVLGRLARSLRVLSDILFIKIFEWLILIFIRLSLHLVVVRTSFFTLDLLRSPSLHKMSRVVTASPLLLLRSVLHAMMYHKRGRPVILRRWRGWRHEWILLLLVSLLQRTFLVPKENVQSL